MNSMTRKVLVTGTFANQYSEKTIKRTASFTDGLIQILTRLKYEVVIAAPTFDLTEKDLSQFSHIFIGIGAPTSVSANGAYHSLNLAGVCNGRRGVTLFLDTPEPWKIYGALRAIEKDENVLFKTFYSKRFGYSTAKDDIKVRNNIFRGIELVSSLSSTRMVYPTLPWSTNQLFGVPDGIRSSFIPIQIDSVYIDDHVNLPTGKHDHSWIIENLSSKWTKNTVNTLSARFIETKDMKTNSCRKIMDQLTRRIGIIIGPHNDGVTWWSPRYSQALNSGTVVVTDWRFTKSLGESWNYLAGAVEEMSPIDLFELSIAQKRSYIDVLHSIDQITEHLNTIMEVK